MRFCKNISRKGTFKSAVSAMAIIVFTMMFAVGSASAASCTAASFKGVYGFFTSGFENSEGLAIIGQISSNGAGTLTGTITHDFDGNPSTASITGSYTIVKACTGTLTFTQSGSTYNFSFDLNSSNKAFQVIETDTGTTVVGFIQPLATATCGLSGHRKRMPLMVSEAWAALVPWDMAGNWCWTVRET